VRYRVQTQLAIGVSGILIVISTLLIFFIESGHTFAAFSLLDQWSLSLFHAVSSRTAGFHAIPISWFHPASIFVIIIFMFIGASPGSTGGGIKTTTVGVLVKSFWSTIRGESDTVLFERRIGSDAAYRALAIMVISLACIIGFVFLLLYLEPLPFLDIVFEVVSAFGTVGYSLGKTAMFHPVSKLLLIILMIIGRLGPLSIAIAFTQKKSSRRHRYPEERILLG